jgi:hypothetical protein
MGMRFTRRECFDKEHLSIMLKQQWQTQKEWRQYVSPLTCSATGNCTL